MCPLLEFEADRRCFLITINSFNTELTKDLREKLYPTCGKLYPEGLTMLNACEDFEQVLLVKFKKIALKVFRTDFLNFKILGSSGCRNVWRVQATF